MTQKELTNMRIKAYNSKKDFINRKQINTIQTDLEINIENKSKMIFDGNKFIKVSNKNKSNSNNLIITPVGMITNRNI